MSQPPPEADPALARRQRSRLTAGAGAIIVHDGRVLLVRNIRGVTAGRYLLPAGWVEAGELPDHAAAREAFEETNLRVDIAGLLGVRLWVMDSGEHNYFFMFLAKLRSPVSDLRPNLAEIDDARWFTPDEMDALSQTETFQGAVAIAKKALAEDVQPWPNHGRMSDRTEPDRDERWRIWL